MTGEIAATNVVGKYVDGLHVCVYGEPRVPVFEELREAKRALHASAYGLRMLDTISGVPGGALTLTTGGGSKYQFIFRNDAIRHLEVTSRGELPKVMVQFRSRALYEHDLEDVEAFVESIADHFLESGYVIKVSSFDIALDFQGAEWQWPEVGDIVCRARRRRVDYAASTTGMTFGKHSSPIQVVMYDKTQEIREHNNGWMESAWATKESYSAASPVIRVELRFSRALLRDFDIGTISNLRSGMGDLVRYAVGGSRPWFRVVAPESRARKTERRASAPWWEEIRSAFLDGMPETGYVRRRSVSSVPALKRARTMSITSTVQTAAWDRVLVPHPALPPEEYLGPVLLPFLTKWLEARGFSSWEEAVDFEAKRIISSGKAPYGLAPVAQRC